MTKPSKQKASASGKREKTYVDAKGRKRWHNNDVVAHRVRQLGEYLIIGGYPEAHAARYARIAHTISRLPESMNVLCDSGRLDSINGVGGVITGYLEEIVRTGTTSKFDDDQYGPPPPQSVLELTAVVGLGPKTARTLYRELGITDRKSLAVALDDGRLAAVNGIGPKLLTLIERYCLDSG